MPLRRLRAEQAHPATLHGPEVPLPALGTALARASAAALLEPLHRPAVLSLASGGSNARLLPGQQPSAPQQTPTLSAGSSAGVSADAVSGE